jgi:hypothetical protein
MRVDGPSGVRPHYYRRAQRLKEDVLSMSKIGHIVAVVIVILVMAIGLSACGSGGDVIARVGDAAITKGELNHWMNVFIAGDFEEVSHGRAVPAGLVSEPPDDAGCVQKLKAAAVVDTQTVNLTAMCQHLYQGLRLQALKWLVEKRWRLRLATALGLAPTNNEVTRLYAQLKAQLFPTEAQRASYLGARNMHLADFLYIVKLDLMDRKILAKAKAGVEQAVAEFKQAAAKSTAETDCSDGYVVEDCKQFKAPGATYPVAPSILLEQVAALTGTPCRNHQACGSIPRVGG